MMATSIEGSPRAKDEASFVAVVAATLGIAVLPAAVVFRLLAGDGDARWFVLVTAGVVATAAVVLIASWLWERHPDSSLFSFGDLMLWNWIRRRRAERSLVRNTSKLGFARDGAYLGDPSTPRDKRLQVLGRISLALDAKSSYTYKHTDRVERIARRIAGKLGLPAEQVDEVAVAALLHDVGNVRIPEHIQRKPGTLTQEERELVESHALLGALMSYEAVERRIADGILHHHERWDGAGYPNGIAGERIPMYARIVAVAEAFDAMTSTRPYRGTVTPRSALATLKLEAGRQFDPEVVDALGRCLPRPLVIFELLRLPPRLQPRAWESLLAVKRAGAVALLVAVTTAMMALVLGTNAVSPGTVRDAPPSGERR